MVDRQKALQPSSNSARSAKKIFNEQYFSNKLLISIFQLYQYKSWQRARESYESILPSESCMRISQQENSKTIT